MNAENPVQIDLFGVSATGTKDRCLRHRHQRHEAGRAYRRFMHGARLVRDRSAWPVAARRTPFCCRYYRAAPAT
jgi:hypothetical protein